MEPVVAGIFALVYLGMLVGEVPGLKIDRTGIALLGAIALIATGRISLDAAWDAIDIGTIALLFGLMVVSAQFRLGGFYTMLTRRLGSGGHSPQRLLALVTLSAAGLSAVLANDIVCLAMAPVLIEVCTRRRLNPLPYLLALACASNVGSAATLIGNPQNILIGQAGGLDFFGFILVCGPPAVMACVVVWLVVWAMWRGRWTMPDGTGDALIHVPFESGAMVKALIATAALLMLFAAPIPREAAALAIAVALMVSRRFASRDLVARVDWNLLLLFAGLFVVTGAFSEAGWSAGLGQWMQAQGFAPDRAVPLAAASLIGSNLIGNVPFVVVLLQVAPDMSTDTLHALALLSTLAGNLLIVGSVVNLIVAESARQQGVRLRFMEFARVGIPVALISMTLATGWLVAGGWLIW
jgi:Na+/H+ antiporter NhaD/arsenite permease-like protein